MVTTPSRNSTTLLFVFFVPCNNSAPISRSSQTSRRSTRSLLLVGYYSCHLAFLLLFSPFALLLAALFQFVVDLQKPLLLRLLAAVAHLLDPQLALLLQLRAPASFFQVFDFTLFLLTFPLETLSLLP